MQKGLFIYDYHYLRCVSTCDNLGAEQNNGNMIKTDCSSLENLGKQEQDSGI